MAGEYTFKLIATEPNSLLKNESTFKVTVRCTVTKLNVAQLGVQDVVYKIDTAQAIPTVMPIPTYTFEPATCIKPLTLKLEVVERPDKTKTTFPTFITESLTYSSTS